MAPSDSSKNKLKVAKRKTQEIQKYDKLLTVYKKYMRQHSGHGEPERENT